MTKGIVVESGGVDTFDTKIPIIQIVREYQVSSTVWRTSGLVTCTQGSKNVVGNAYTSFLTELKPGDYVMHSNRTTVYQVESITDNSHLTLTSNYVDTTLADYNLWLGYSPTAFLGFDAVHASTKKTIPHGMRFMPIPLGGLNTTGGGVAVAVDNVNIYCLCGVHAFDGAINDAGVQSFRIIDRALNVNYESGTVPDFVPFTPSQMSNGIEIKADEDTLFTTREKKMSIARIIANVTPTLKTDGLGVQYNEFVFNHNIGFPVIYDLFANITYDWGGDTFFINKWSVFRFAGGEDMVTPNLYSDTSKVVFKDYSYPNGPSLCSLVIYGAVK